MSTSYSSDDSDKKTPQQSPSKSPLSLRAFLEEAVFVGAEDIEVTHCVDRADKCRPGDVFIPRNNAQADEHDRVDEAIKRGAVAVVCDRILPVSVPQCLVEETQETYARVCQSLYGDPSKRMLTIGVVGTSGKSATALFVASMLKKLGGAVSYYTSLGSSDSTACDRTTTKPPGGKTARRMDAASRSGGCTCGGH